MLRLLIIGQYGTPIFEVGERLSQFHDLPFFSIEPVQEIEENYWTDDIPENTLDTGDMTSGSERQQMQRDPASLMLEKTLDDQAVVSVDQLYNLTDEEISQILKFNQAIVTCQIPDIRLVNWATDIIHLKSDIKEVVEWFGKRLHCSSCQAVYHLDERPPLEVTICDRCGSDLIRKDEDNPELVRRELYGWQGAFIKFINKSKEREIYQAYNLSKYKQLEELISDINLKYRGKISKRNWYEDLISSISDLKPGKGNVEIDLNVMSK